MLCGGTYTAVDIPGYLMCCNIKINNYIIQLFRCHDYTNEEISVAVSKLKL